MGRVGEMKVRGETYQIKLSAGAGTPTSTHDNRVLEASRNAFACLSVRHRWR